MAETTQPSKLQERETRLKLCLCWKDSIANPALTHHELRVKLGALDDLAAEIFALTVFLCDELLLLKPASHPATLNPATRFFAIAKRLPLELQMILCHRGVGSMKQNIRHKDSEPAFESLATILRL